MTSNRARERFYDAARKTEHGMLDYPLCNIPGCGLPVRPGERWVESHYPIPKAHGGTQTGVAHFRCNATYASTVEVPQMARGKRARQRHIGAHKSRNPLPGGRDDPRGLQKTMDGRVVKRRSLREKMIDAGLLRIVDAPGE